MYDVGIYKSDQLQLVQPVVNANKQTEFVLIYYTYVVVVHNMHHEEIFTAENRSTDLF